MTTDADAVAEAIAEAELLLRRLRTGQLTGFVAVATDAKEADGACIVSTAGRINLLQTGAMLDCQSRRCFDVWHQEFSADHGEPELKVAAEEHDGES